MKKKENNHDWPCASPEDQSRCQHACVCSSKVNQKTKQMNVFTKYAIEPIV